MDALRKIISDGEPGERTPARAYLPRLQPYLPGRILFDRLCAACWQGTGQIMLLTWRWIRAAAPGDRWIRGLAPAGGAAAAVYAIWHEPRLAVGGLLAAWSIAAMVLAPREVWREQQKAAEEPAPAAESGASLDTPEGRRIAFLHWLEKTTRGTSGIHLNEMHRQLALQAPAEHLPRHHLRPLLNHYGIPVQRTLRVGRIAGRSGVSRDAILRALATPPPEAETNPVDPPGDMPRPA